MTRDSPPSQAWTLRYGRLAESEAIRALERHGERKVMMRSGDLVRPACSLNNVLVILDPYGDLAACAMLFPVNKRMQDVVIEIAAAFDEDNTTARNQPEIFAYEAAHLCANKKSRLMLEIGTLLHLVRIQIAVTHGWSQPIIWNVFANNGGQIHVLEKRVGVQRLNKRPKYLEAALRARVEKYLAFEATLPARERWFGKMPDDLDEAVLTFAAPAQEGRFFAQRLRGVLSAFKSAPLASGRHLRVEGTLLRQQLSAASLDSLGRETDISVVAPWYENDLTKL